MKGNLEHISEDRLHKIESLITELLNSGGKDLRDHFPKEELSKIVNDLQNLIHSNKNTRFDNRAMIQANPDVIFRLSSEGHIIDYHAHPGVLIRPESSFQNANITDVLPEEYHEECIELINKAIETEETQYFFHNMLFEGKYYFFEGRIVKNGDDEVLKIVRDITQQTKKEKIGALINRASELQGKKNISITNFCQVIGSELSKIFDFSSVFVAQKEQKNDLSCLYLDSENLIEFIEHHKETTRNFVSEVLDKGQAKILNPTNEGQHWVGIPLIASDTPIGLLGFISNIADSPFDKEDLELLKTLGNQIAIWIEKKKLEDHETSVNEIFENFLYEIYIVGIEDFRFRFANQCAREKLGYSLEELKELTPYEISDIYDNPETQKLLESFIPGDTTETWFESYHINSNGDTYPIEINLRKSEYKGEKVLVAMARDISLRREVYKNLKEFAHFFNESKDLMCISDKHGYFLKVNKAFTDVLGYTSDELLAKPFFHFIHPEDIEKTQKELSQLSQGINTLNFENRYICKDGSIKWLNWSATPDNETGIGYASARDITEWKSVNDKIQKANLDLGLIDKIYYSLTQNNPLEELISLTMDSFPKLLDFHSGRFYLYDENSNQLILKDQRLTSNFIEQIERKTGLKMENLVPSILEGSKYSEVIETQKMIAFQSKKEVTEILREHTDSPIIKRLAGWVQRLTNINGALVIPLQLDNKIFGIVQVNSEKMIPEETIQRINRFINGITAALAKSIAEKATAESEIKLKEAQRIAHIGSWDWQVNSNELLWSDELFKIFEVDQNAIDIDFELYMSCIHPEDREMVQGYVQNAMVKKQPYTFRHRINTHSQRVKYVESRGNFELNEDGEVTRLFGTCLDITDRVESEQAKEKFTQQLEDLVSERTKELRVYQNELKYQVDSLNHVALVSITDLQGNITYVNDIFCRDSGYSREELIGQNHRIFKTGQQSDSIYHNLWETISSGKIWNGELMNKSKDGSYYWVDTTIVPFINLKGEIEKFMSVNFNITEQKSMQSQLTESLNRQMELGELKSRFISTASHQFRTPLTVIKSNVDLLKLNLNSIKEENKNLIEKVVNRNSREVERMTKIMDELLTLEKISAGGVAPVFSLVNVLKVCQDSIDNYNQIQDDDRIAQLEIIGTPYDLELDKNLFEDAFSNILSNAFKYSKNRPAPHITIDFKDESLNIKVIDFGMGIPEKDLKNLFNPFFRASNVLDIPGTGLGTSIMKEYIEINNGTLLIESEVGEGTKVEINLTKMEYEEYL